MTGEAPSPERVIHDGQNYPIVRLHAVAAPVHDYPLRAHSLIPGSFLGANGIVSLPLKLPPVPDLTRGPGRGDQDPGRVRALTPLNNQCSMWFHLLVPGGNWLTCSS